KLDRIDRIESCRTAAHLVTAGAVDLQVVQPGREDSVEALVGLARRRAMPDPAQVRAVDLNPARGQPPLAREQGRHEPAHWPSSRLSAAGSSSSGGRRI